MTCIEPSCPDEKVTPNTPGGASFSSISLTADGRNIHARGLVSILKQLHAGLDAAIPNSHFGIRHLPCLVALNHAHTEDLSRHSFRATAEEKRGLIRWLRPEYQAKGEEQRAESRKPEQPEFAGVTAASSRQQTKDKGQQTAQDWPKTLPEQVRVLRLVLEAQSGSIDSAALAKNFRGVRKDRIAILLETLPPSPWPRPSSGRKPIHSMTSLELQYSTFALRLGTRNDYMPAGGKYANSQSCVFDQIAFSTSDT